MTRLTGKVISRPFDKKPPIGAQIVHEVGMHGIYKVLEYSPFYNGEIVIKSGNTLKNIGYKWLRELCIEYKKEAVEPWLDWKSVIVPLKYSQWQTAIDNGEVDSDKEVIFELVPSVSTTMKNPSVPIAKIIPVKKERLYTIEQVKSISREAYYKGRLDEIEVHEFKSDGISICSKVHPDKCFEEWYSKKITKFNN